MPLLRQALYQQNVNLYLAPTADNRDAWLSLMRTVGLEGRCFVVSSNMCIRNGSRSSGNNGVAVADKDRPSHGVASSHNNGNGNGNGHVSGTNGGVAAAAPVTIAGDPLNGIPDSHPRGSGRRNSCFTEEGFEIALPEDGAAGDGVAEAAQLHHHHPMRKERRRSSIIDEDGNEIVLCGQKDASITSTSAIDEEDDDDDDDDDDEKAGHTNGVALSHRVVQKISTAELRSSSGHHQRQSTFGLNSPVSPKQPTQLANGKAAAAATAGSGAGFLSRGGSSIISPFGEVLAGPQWEDEHGLIYADVDFDDCVRGRLDIDVAGSYSRNDTFKFSVEGLDLDPLPYY